MLTTGGFFFYTRRVGEWVSAILLMAGEGERAATPIPKQYCFLGDKRVYQHTLDRFHTSGLFAEIILVCASGWRSLVEEEVADFPLVKVVIGGMTRQASSCMGVRACVPSCHYVMIHDAVRPFVSLDILVRNLEAMKRWSAVDTCIPSHDTIVTTLDGTTIQAIPPRSGFLRGQTPQTFAAPVIRKAHEATQRWGATDDCQLVMDLGVPVGCVEGSEHNLKITTAWDLDMARLRV